MNNFLNVALVPADKKFMRSCIQLAQANLKDQSSQYLLGESALPHVTLCEFVSEGTDGGNLSLQEIGHP